MEIIFWLGFSALVAYYADKKGRNAVLWGLLALLISPLLAGIALAVSKDLTVDKSIQDLDYKAEMLKVEMQHNQRFNDLRNDNLEKNINRLSASTADSRFVETSRKEYMQIPNHTSRSASSIADELQKLNELKLSGILTEEEFTHQKNKLLNM